MLVVKLVGFSQSEHIFVFEKPLYKKVRLIRARLWTVIKKTTRLLDLESYGCVKTGGNLSYTETYADVICFMLVVWDSQDVLLPSSIVLILP